MASLISIFGIIYMFVTTAFTQSPSRPDTSSVKGTSFLDHDALLAGFFGQTFLKENVPLLDIPDQLIQDVFHYRWTSLQRNLRYVLPGAGWMCTEFVQPVWYAKAFGTIDAAAGHQIDEARWLRSAYYTDDYIQLYSRGPADSFQYTQWIMDAMSRQAMVTGDRGSFSAQLDDMIRMWHEWDSVFDEEAGLYYYKPVWDAQELSLPGFIADPDGNDWNLRNDGPDTYRPSHNAYMVANARAIARAADIANNGAVEEQFTELANTLEKAMYDRLWAPEQNFFMDIIRPNNPDLTRLTGREQVGLFPYRFGIGLDESHAQPAVDTMFDPEGFLAPYGPPTLEIRDPWFMSEKVDPGRCCYWNGMSWPYSTSHTLKSLAAIYRSGTTDVTAEQYHQYLQTYAKTQQKDDRPYVAESHFPLRDGWSADSSNHSEHYDHSTNNDDVITGLLGILPQPDDSLVISPIVPEDWTYFGIENVPYHGHLVTVLYDKDGSHYGQGSGLTVFVDGENVANTAEKAVTVSVPPPVVPSSEALVNIAANPSGPGNQYPKADATFTYEADYSYKAIDGVLYYDDIPNNRWTNYRSPNANDTLTVTFARPRKMSSVTLALYSDVARGGRVDLPARIEVYGSDGRVLATVEDAAGLLANDRNEIAFADGEAETASLAVNLYRRSGDLWVGVCELEVWTPPETGPTYHAVDAYLGTAGGSARVVYEDGGGGGRAVVGGLVPDSVISFAGVVGPSSSSAIEISYRNNGADAVNLQMEVNHAQPAAATVSLAPTGDAYGTARVEGVKLAVGKNWVNLVGGTDTLRIETLTVQ